MLSALPEHPNVINLVGLCRDFETTDHGGARLAPPISFVSEFFEKGSIEDFFKRRDRDPGCPDIVFWLRDIAAGLSHLHMHGVVHRDLAPRNIFIDNDGKAVVGDLGLARPVGPDEKTSPPEGNINIPTGASPHATATLQYTRASDVFSLGLLLFAIATECKAASPLTWDDETKTRARLSKVKVNTAALISQFPTQLPVFLKDLMSSCLSTDPGKRPTADAIVNQIDAWNQVCMR